MGRVSRDGCCITSVIPLSGLNRPIGRLILRRKTAFDLLAKHEAVLVRETARKR